jgi:hypothetical protein
MWCSIVDVERIKKYFTACGLREKLKNSQGNQWTQIRIINKICPSTKYFDGYKIFKI